jgi:hypothetical protein
MIWGRSAFKAKKAVTEVRSVINILNSESLDQEFSNRHWKTAGGHLISVLSHFNNRELPAVQTSQYAIAYAS